MDDAQEKPDPEMLKNIELLMNMNLLENEENWGVIRDLDAKNKTDDSASEKGQKTND